MDELQAFFLPYHEQFEILLHVLIALILGGAIGLEREMKRRPAGLRTHMLVAAAAVMLTDLTTILITQTALILQVSLDAIDPIRVIVAIVTGISFLGAGTIFRSDDKVSGLTTAATLLIAGTLGITIALEQYVLAIGTTLIVLVVTRVFGVVSERVSENASTEDHIP